MAGEAHAGRHAAPGETGEQQPHAGGKTFRKGEAGRRRLRGGLFRPNLGHPAEGEKEFVAQGAGGGLLRRAARGFLREDEGALEIAAEAHEARHPAQQSGILG